jgi:hypothetical protein
MVYIEFKAKKSLKIQVAMPSSLMCPSLSLCGETKLLFARWAELPFISPKLPIAVI